MITKAIKPILKGICVAAFVSALGVTAFSPEWWVAVIAMNAGLNYSVITPH